MHVIAIQISTIENQPTLWSLYDANRAECCFLWLYMFKAAPQAGSALEFMRAMPGKCLHTVVPQFSDLFFCSSFHWHLLSLSFGRNF